MAHIRTLGFFCGIFLVGWIFSLHYSHLERGNLAAWVAPALILAICIFLGIRRSAPVAVDPQSRFITFIKSGLGVVVIAVIIFNIGAYIYFRTLSDVKTPPFQAALLYSWAMLALGMVLALGISAGVTLAGARK